jgi:hypothetical protein
VPLPALSPPRTARSSLPLKTETNSPQNEIDGPSTPARDRSANTQFQKNRIWKLRHNPRRRRRDPRRVCFPLSRHSAYSGYSAVNTFLPTSVPPCSTLFQSQTIAITTLFHLFHIIFSALLRPNGVGQAPRLSAVGASPTAASSREITKPKCAQMPRPFTKKAFSALPDRYHPHDLILC